MDDIKNLFGDVIFEKVSFDGKDFELEEIDEDSSEYSDITAVLEDIFGVKIRAKKVVETRQKSNLQLVVNSGISNIPKDYM